MSRGCFVDEYLQIADAHTLDPQAVEGVSDFGVLQSDVRTVVQILSGIIVTGLRTPARYYYISGDIILRPP